MKSNLLIAFLIAAATATPALGKDKIKANNQQIIADPVQSTHAATNQNQGTTKKKKSLSVDFDKKFGGVRDTRQ